MYAKFGKNVKKEIINSFKEDEPVKKFLKSIPGVSKEIIDELIAKGVVKQPLSILKAIVIGMGSNISWYWLVC